VFLFPELATHAEEEGCRDDEQEKRTWVVANELIYGVHGWEGIWVKSTEAKCYTLFPIMQGDKGGVKCSVPSTFE
jgi:hypothetical protein